MKIREGIALGYDDVLLVPKYSKIVSRANVELTSEVINGVFLDLPIMAASMDTVTEWEMAVAMAKMGGVGVIHRYLTLEQQISQVNKFLASMPTGQIGVAIGVVDDYVERAVELCRMGVSFLSIDVAHGDHALVIKALNTIKGHSVVKCPLMVGNVATALAAKRLESFGADAIKVGIGPGSVCTTRIESGSGYPQLSAIIECAEVVDIPICADGGIQNSGDIAKALAAGASSVMIGGMFAGTVESPTEVINLDGEHYKLFRGMASESAKMDNGMPGRNIEGTSKRVPCRGPVREILLKLEDGIKSGLSYSGSATIKDFWNNAEFVRVNKIK